MMFYRLRLRFSFIFGVFLMILLIIYSIKPSKNVFDERINDIFTSAKRFSLCSPRSARRGLDQHVLSVSAYESTDQLFLVTSLTWFYLEEFVTQAKKFYPSWIVRVYHFDLFNKTQKDFDDFEAKFDNLDFCPSENLPVLGNVRKKLPGKMQRFLPSIDPMVGVFVVRDLDSEIYEREKSAVNEWLLETSYAFHIMRDNAVHDIEMLGGMWGLASNRLSLLDRIRIANALLPSDDPMKVDKFYKTYANRGDQLFLTHHIWPIARQNSIAHDSYTCLWSRYIYRAETRPFPTRKQHPNCFVGCSKPCCKDKAEYQVDPKKFRQCPHACRPSKHPDWLFC